MLQGALRGSPSVATEIKGQFRPGKDKIVRRLFGPVAKVIWPDSTDACVAAIGKVDVRTARRWMSGEFEPNGLVIAAVVVAITKRD